MEQRRYDVVIAGLGPAGTAALWHLARSGLRVAALDWRTRDKLWGKPCGDALGAHHPREAGLPEPPAEAVKNRVDAVDIYSPGETTKYRVRGEGYIIDRGVYGRWLLSQVEDRDNVDVFLGAKVVAPIIEGGRVAGVEAEIEGRRVKLYASVVVEATGFSRAIRTRLPREWPIYEPIDPRDVNIAYREIIEYNDYEIDEPNVIRIYLDQETAPGGYWWFFPESSHAANVGLGVQGGMGHPNPVTLYTERLSKHPLLSKPHRRLAGAGAPLPTRRPSNTLVGPGIVVVGDAGYTVNPVHGGGMGYAFRSAYEAARAIEEAYDRGDFSERGLWGLNVRYMRSLGAKQAALDVFRRFLQRLSNEEIRYGMEKRLIPEQDVLYTSTIGEIRVSALEKARIVLRGLRRPSLLSKLKMVADYMARVKQLYASYPEQPEGLRSWVEQVDKLFEEFEARLAKR